MRNLFGILRFLGNGMEFSGEFFCFVFALLRINFRIANITVHCFWFRYTKRKFFDNFEIFATRSSRSFRYL